MRIGNWEIRRYVEPTPPPPSPVHGYFQFETTAGPYEIPVREISLVPEGVRLTMDTITGPLTVPQGSRGLVMTPEGLQVAQEVAVPLIGLEDGPLHVLAVDTLVLTYTMTLKREQPKRTWLGRGRAR